MSFDGKRFNEVWRDLDDQTREEIKAKAKWEGITLAAAMRGWWPEIWMKVIGPKPKPTKSEGSAA